jgi:hypothetical protein
MFEYNDSSLDFCFGIMFMLSIQLKFMVYSHGKFGLVLSNILYQHTYFDLFMLYCCCIFRLKWPHLADQWMKTLMMQLRKLRCDYTDNYDIVIL